KVIAGLETPDTGTITRRNLLTIEYLPQNPNMDENATVLQQVYKGTSPVMQVLGKYQEAAQKLAVSPDNNDLQQQLIHLSSQMDSLGAWQVEAGAKAVLTRLGINQFGAQISSFSGGQRKRIALASSLITPADLLILDEPTNHLDSDTIDWLEQYLEHYQGALIMVTHDRYFLDRVVRKTFELDHGILYSYTGNYSYFLQAKMEREEQLQASERKRQSLLRKELEWIRKGARARTTKQKARIQRFDKLQEMPTAPLAAKLELEAASSRLGKQIIELDHVSKGFSGYDYIRDFNYVLARYDRIGIIGPNGIGKTTLLNLIAGRIEPDCGLITRGQTVKIGYFTQETPFMDDQQRPIDYIKEVAEYLTLANGRTLSSSQMLERFLFPGELQWVLLSKLSGGEKRRLFLARLLMEAPNVLILDEPTNDLDIETLTVLEDYLDDYSGVIIIASHDRYFLDRTTNKIFAFTDSGQIVEYPGNYSDYLEAIKDTQFTIPAQSSDRVKKGEQVQRQSSPALRKKFSFNEQREFEQIDSTIANKEHELLMIKKEIELASSDYTRLQGLLDQQQQLEMELSHLLDRWVYLNELAEEMSKNN
ncbi:MAG: ABC-F family ATP-binding cassette domain-containing protein, partial [Methylocystaceae bacterium]